MASPLIASPPAKTPGIEVIRFSSTTIVPSGLVLSLPSSVIILFGSSPMAIITVSASNVTYSPVPTIFLFPLLSRSSSGFVLSNLTALTLPFSSPMNSTGCRKNSNFTPSSSACFISSSLAVMSSLPLL
ncbi:128aa long hypothetical protein [Pyrococcus horikoshii OT3]|uniref:Uncharacterized protein n=1 Tax=Pyrococcus horikoshii (strain ATCC 700860 / DSM 12428 / JCM 9974 / NBRC 100139 / OT-3) TaxID=70601 RepID=O58607_PYRHO|nr:128aa long hypothetical protein [Pyrococcus horikoshii OT3]